MLVHSRLSVSPAPPARRGHKAEAAAPSSVARLHQGCVDIIVEYAVRSAEAILQLRRVSLGFAAGVAAFFTFVNRGQPAHDADMGLVMEAEALSAYLGGGIGDFSYEGLMFLTVLYRAPADGGPAKITIPMARDACDPDSTGHYSNDTLIRSVLRRFGDR
jgi:hypothetical protein